MIWLARLVLDVRIASHVGAVLAGEPQMAERIECIAKRESRFEIVGLHEGDAWMQRRLGAGLSTRGVHGQVAAFALPSWLHSVPWLLDVPLVSAFIATRRARSWQCKQTPACYSWSLCRTSHDFPRPSATASSSVPADAGRCKALTRATATSGSGSVVGCSTSTESHTRSSMGHSTHGDRSITSAATAHAATQTTSTWSPLERTRCVGSPSAPCIRARRRAPPGIRTTRRTHTALHVAVGCAGHAAKLLGALDMTHDRLPHDRLVAASSAGGRTASVATSSRKRTRTSPSVAAATAVLATANENSPAKPTCARDRKGCGR